MNEHIRELIKALNMKQAEFAKRIGVSRPFVSELCSGNKKPSDRTVADICREFNVNEQWLRTGEGDMFLCIELVAKYASKRGGEMVEKERIRELLEKQLELLSEQSRGDPAMLPQLTDSMVQVVSLLRSL